MPLIQDDKLIFECPAAGLYVLDSDYNFPVAHIPAGIIVLEYAQNAGMDWPNLMERLEVAAVAR